MTAWPTLTTGAEREDYQQFVLEDPTLRSLSLDGRVLSRRAPKRILYGFTFVLRHLSCVDKETLEQFQLDTKVGGEIFTWDDERPNSGSSGIGSTWTVRLAEPMIFDLDDEAATYRTEVKLLQEPGYAPV